jgi:replicative DNA helicase
MREQEVAAISRMLKATAKELNVPIIALSQLSRQAENRQGGNRRPQLSDLRESGSIEQDADMVVFIHRFDYQGLSENADDIGRTQIIIAKHRNGAIADVDMKFRADEVRFVDLTDTVYAQADNVGVDSAMNSDDAASAQAPVPYAPMPDAYDAYPPDEGFGGGGFV